MITEERKKLDLSYKNATKENLEIIYQYNKELLERYTEIQPMNQEVILKALWEKIENSIERYKMLYLEDEEVGFYCIHTRNEEIELEDLCVYPAYQSQKIGTTVIEHCLEKANLPVQLYVFKENVGAWRLYEKLGFYIVRNIENSVYMMVR